MIDRNISIGTVQFAINTEQNSHIMADHPVGSISRMFTEIISQNLSYLGFQSDTASLIISKPELNINKQLIYTSILPIETARKIFDNRFYDYLIFGELKFENVLKVEITIINRFNDKSIRRELSIKNYNLFALSIDVIEESLKLIQLDLDLSNLKEINKYSTNSLKAWGWYALSYESDLDNSDKILSLEKAINQDNYFVMAKLKQSIIEFEENNDFDLLKQNCSEINSDLINYFAFNYEILKEKNLSFSLYKISHSHNLEQNEVLPKLIKLAYDNNDLENFNTYINKYIESVGESDFDYENIPLYIYLSGKYDLAIEKLTQGIKLYPFKSKIYTTLAYVYMSEHNFKESANFYEKSFELNKDINVLEDWTSVLVKQKEYKKVINLLKIHNEDLIPNSGTLCNLAISYIAINDKDTALKILEKAVRNDKNNPKLNSLLGNIYLDQKSFSRSQKYFYLALQDEPNNYLWNVNMGDLYFEQENFIEADKYYDKALHINNALSLPKKLITEAYILESKKMFQEAINKYIKASKLLPKTFIPVKLMTKIFVENKDYDTALNILESKIDIFLNDIDLWILLLEIYQNKENSFFGKKWKTKSQLAQNMINQLKSNL